MVTLPALPVAVQPQGKHGGLAAESPFGLHQTVHAATGVHEIQVRAVAHLAGKGHDLSGNVLEIAHSGVVPIYAIALLRAEERDVNVHIAVPQVDFLSADAQVGVLPLAHAVQELIGFGPPGLRHAEASRIGIPLRPGLESGSRLGDQGAAGHCIGERDVPRNLVKGEGQGFCAENEPRGRFFPFYNSRTRFQHHVVAPLCGGSAGGVFHHPHYLGRVNRDFAGVLLRGYGFMDYRRGL